MNKTRMVAENDNDDKESKAEKENIHNNEEACALIMMKTRKTRTVTEKRMSLCK